MGTNPHSEPTELKLRVIIKGGERNKAMEETPEVIPDDNNNLEEPQTPQTPVDEIDLTVEQLSQKVNELEGLLEREKSDKFGIIEQLKEVRRAKQEAEAKSLGKPEITQPIGDVTELKVKEVLKKEREILTQENRVVALHKFWEKHPEFNSENDISGIKMDAVNQKLRRINSSAYAVDDILQDYEDALQLMTPKNTTVKSNLNPFASTSPTPTNPLQTDKSLLNPIQEKLRQTKGWTVKKYLEMKAKHPQIVP